jgi:hypothetical protein
MYEAVVARACNAELLALAAVELLANVDTDAAVAVLAIDIEFSANTTGVLVEIDAVAIVSNAFAILSK